jgi:mannose-6-phosphate isomerase
VGPIVLGANQPPRFYRGGSRIAAFRGEAALRDDVPEDWVGSTTTVFGRDELGITRLPDGQLLADVIAKDPVGWLGPTFRGAAVRTAPILIKLLDAGERLPVHVHPSRTFAAAALGSQFGKTEAWVILDAEPGAKVHLGFRRAVSRRDVDHWVRDQVATEMLSAMNDLIVEPGDALLVPAGLPHAIGSGVFLIELQEPTDYSVLLEWRGFGIDGATDGHLGLGFERALDCVNLDTIDLASLVRRNILDGNGNGRDLLPSDANAFFRAQLHGPGSSTLDTGYSIAIVTSGEGQLASRQSSVPIRRGMTLIVPHEAGKLELTGDVQVLLCRPPLN